jgi:hypothetical protein
VLVVTLLHHLTSNAKVVGSPQSASDVVAVSSSPYRVESPQFRASVTQLETASP